MTLGASLMLLSMRSSCWAVSQHAPVRGDFVFKQNAALCYDRACLFDVISFVCFLKAFYLAHFAQSHKVVSVYVNNACVASS
jgi:hypothetical protein